LCLYIAVNLQEKDTHISVLTQVDVAILLLLM